MEQYNGALYPDCSKIRDFLTRETTTIANKAVETTIFTAASGLCHDVYQVTATNTSTNTIAATIRDTTAGSAVLILQLPASVTTTFNFSPPMKQSAPNKNWTLAMVSNANSNTSLTFYVAAVNIPTDIKYN